MGVVRTLEIFLGTHILLVSRGRLCDSSSFLFINFASFKPDTENNVNIDAVSSKRTKFDEVQFFKTYT